VSAHESVIVDDLGELRALLRTSPDAASLRPIGVREVVRGEGALRLLPDILRRLGCADESAVTVISDRMPKRYADDDVLDVVLDVVGSAHPIALEFVEATETGGLVLADEMTVARAVDGARQHDSVALVSVGSGTLTDIAKVVAAENGLTHVVVQTAASVNGFSDDQSVLLINGAKRTTPSRWPDAIVIDPLVVTHAPPPMSASGLGDQLSMFSAGADWYLADAVGFDTSYSPTLVTMMGGGVDDLMAASSALGRGEPDAVSVLAECLTRGGLAMGAAGRTAPSSGLEHTISHLLEMHADSQHRPSASHGSQVGVASAFAALVWERVQRRLAEGNLSLLESNVATRQRVLEAFDDLDASGATARECWNLYERKALWIRDHLGELSRVVEAWPTHGPEVDRLLRPVDDIVSALHNAHAPVTFRQLDPAPDRAVVTWAISNCHLLRDRFGVLDLADLMGLWSPDDALSVLDDLDEMAQ
jgi:glycerol-1-phosphate dehydrogenase [NAD(P)+]